MKTNTSKLFVFNVNLIKYCGLEKLCNDLSVRCIRVPERFNGKRIGDLVKMDFNSQGNEPDIAGDGISKPLPGEMIVFYCFGSELMDTFLKEMKGRNIAPVNLKAVVTAQNIKWTPGMLYAMLDKERRYIEGHRR